MLFRRFMLLATLKISIGVFSFLEGELMVSKSALSELKQILQDLPHMKTEERDSALVRLSEFGIEQPTGPARRPGVTCPFTQMQVVSPCSLRECKQHIANEWSRNCLLEYLEVQRSDALAVEEIAFLYDTSTEQVATVLEQGMAELRASSKETVGFTGDFKRSEAPEIALKMDDEGIKVTLITLAPPFLGSVNTALESAAAADVVFRHPAIKVLGILDAIIGELE